MIYIAIWPHEGITFIQLVIRTANGWPNSRSR